MQIHQSPENVKKKKKDLRFQPVSKAHRADVRRNKDMEVAALIDRHNRDRMVAANHFLRLGSKLRMTKVARKAFKRVIAHEKACAADPCLGVWWPYDDQQRIMLLASLDDCEFAAIRDALRFEFTRLGMSESMWQIHWRNPYAWTAAECRVRRATIRWLVDVIEQWAAAWVLAQRVREEITLIEINEKLPA